jgi:heme/copper-type cytochrome/quinol oxidase subunit 4
MMGTSERLNRGLKSYVIVYICLLALAGLQVVFAYGHAQGAQLFLRMLGVAVTQAGLALMFFMHLRSERRNLLLTLGVSTIFVLAMMNMIWSDSFRLLHFRLPK